VLASRSCHWAPKQPVGEGEGGRSVSEIIDQGVTGAVVDTMEEAARMLPQVLALDRATLFGDGSSNDFRPRAWPRTMLRSTVRC
jgi:hypothetical protein